MKIENRYLKYVQWSDEDSAYVGFCPDLFPWGGVCHAGEEAAAYAVLCALVSEEVKQLIDAGTQLPAPATRPMREALVA